MIVPKIQSSNLFTPLSRNYSAKTAKASQKLSDVALTPWEFEKMVKEPNSNVVKRYAGSNESPCGHSETADVTVMGYDVC